MAQNQLNFQPQQIRVEQVMLKLPSSVSFVTAGSANLKNECTKLRITNIFHRKVK